MRAMWILVLRAAVAAAYVTLAVSDPHAARDLATEYALLVFVIVLVDIARWRLRAVPR